MTRERRDDLQPYRAHFEALPFVKALAVQLETRRAVRGQADALLRLRTPKGERRLWAEVKKTHLTRPLVEGVLAQMRNFEEEWILLAPYVGGKLGRYLRDNGVNYLDAAGNCHLALDREYFVLIEGRRPQKHALQRRGFRGPGFQVLFAILARPDLLNVPAKTLAEAAGVGKTAAGEMVARLEGEGLTGADREGRRLLQPRALLDRWLAGYAALLRPRLLIGTYHTNDRDPEALEARIENELGQAVTWAWGGGAAAMKLTRHFRGPETVLHVADAAPDLARRLRAVPAGDGQLIVLIAPGPVAFEGVMPRTVHPLLVYTELLAAGDGRAREAAAAVRARHLGWLDR